MPYKDPERMRVYRLAYKVRKAKEIAEYQKWYYREQRARSGDQYDARLARNRARRARVNACESDVTHEGLKDLLSSQGAMCRYCKADISRGAHLDHRMPLAKGGLHMMANLQYLCCMCNYKKFTKDPDEYERSIGFKSDQGPSSDLDRA